MPVRTPRCADPVGRVARRLVATVVALAVAVGLAVSAAPGNGARPPGQDAGSQPLPSREAVASLVQRLRANLWQDRVREEQYTYLEQRRDVRVSKLGKVTLGPLRTFEVYPSSTPGRTYKRLIEVDGVPLSADELAKRDERHRADMMWEKRQRETEPPARQAERARREAERSARQRRELDEAFAVFDLVPLGRERLEDLPQPLLKVSLSPRPSARASSDLVKYLKRCRGVAWVDEAAGQLARLDLAADEDVTVGWGFVGRVHRGSRGVYDRRPVDDDVWLASRARAEVSGRTLLIRLFSFEAEWRWSDYRKFSVETSVIFPKVQ